VYEDQREGVQVWEVDGGEHQVCTSGGVSVSEMGSLFCGAARCSFIRAMLRVADAGC